MNEITLTKEAADDIVATLCKHQDECKDPLVASQYLVAITGYILAANIAQRTDSNDIVAELATFLHHVYDDLTSQESGTAQSAPMAPPAPQGAAADAFGVWKPKK